MHPPIRPILSLLTTLFLCFAIFGGGTLAQSSDDDPCLSTTNECVTSFPKAYEPCKSASNREECFCRPDVQDAYVKEMVGCWRKIGCSNGVFETEEHWRSGLANTCSQLKSIADSVARPTGGSSSGAAELDDADGAGSYGQGVGFLVSMSVSVVLAFVYH